MSLTEMSCPSRGEHQGKLIGAEVHRHHAPGCLSAKGRGGGKHKARRR
jgi:hypothetical protein